MSIFKAFDRFPEEAARIGRMLAAYSVLELDLLHCVQMGTGDFDAAIKAMFSRRGESRRINEAEKLGQPIYNGWGLGADFAAGVAALRACLKIRNQFAHCNWWDDCSGQLAFANLEDLAADPNAHVADLGNLPPVHIDVPLLREQEQFFDYTDALLAWVNFEGRFRRGLLPGGNVLAKPGMRAAPHLRLP